MAFTLQSVAGIMRRTVFIQSVCSSVCVQEASTGHVGRQGQLSVALVRHGS